MRLRRLLPLVLVLLCAACFGPLDVTFTVPPLPQPRAAAPIYPQYGTPLSTRCRPTLVLELAEQSGGPVSALSFDDGGRALLAVHVSTTETPGLLRRWELPDGRLRGAQPLGALTLSGAAFDASGRVLATVGPGIQGVALWHTLKGEVAERVLAKLSLETVRISGDGGLVLAACSPSGLALASTDPGDRDHSVFLSLQTDTGVEVVSRVAVDSEGRFWAYATIEGVVRLFEPHEHQVAIGWGPGSAVLDLRFDSTRRHLALLRQDSLIVKDLRRPLHLAEARVPLEPMRHGAVAFSPSGRLLAIATDPGWQLREVRKLQVLSEDSSVAATAVAFSGDECLLAVGDDTGVVRVYSCAKEQAE